MKAEAEIRAHLEDLKKSQDLPCNCAAEGHAAECEKGSFAIEVSIEVLSWVVGDNPGMDALVKAIAAYGG